MAYDPFQPGGPGSYGGSMLGGEPGRRKHISERGQYADGTPLKADPLEVLRKDRDRLIATIAQLNQELSQVEEKLDLLATSKKKAARPAPTPESSKKRKVSAHDEPASVPESGPVEESE